MENELTALAVELGERAAKARLRIAAAESCTGGWVAKVITDVAGSSAWFDRGFVTYSNQAKIDMLGVDPSILEEHGAVSEPTVLAMARGALARSEADRSVAVSGIAGPGGGTPTKPVGTVWLAWGVAGAAPQARCYQFVGDRETVRYRAAAEAVAGLLARIDGPI